MSIIIAMNNTTSNAKAANNSPPNAKRSIIIADNPNPIQATIFLNRIQRMDTNVRPRRDSVAVAMSCPCAQTSITISVAMAQISRPWNTNNNILNFFKSNITCFCFSIYLCGDSRWIVFGSSIYRSKFYRLFNI